MPVANIKIFHLFKATSSIVSIVIGIVSMMGPSLATAAVAQPMLIKPAVAVHASLAATTLKSIVVAEVPTALVPSDSGSNSAPQNADSVSKLTAAEAAAEALNNDQQEETLTASEDHGGWFDSWFPSVSDDGGAGAKADVNKRDEAMDTTVSVEKSTENVDSKEDNGLPPDSNNVSPEAKEALIPSTAITTDVSGKQNDDEEITKTLPDDNGWFSGLFSFDSDDNNDKPEAKVVIMPATGSSDATSAKTTGVDSSPATANAAAHAVGEAAEEKSDAAVAALAVPGSDAKGAVKELKETQGDAAANAALVAAKAEARAKVPTSSGTEPPHADVFAQPKSPATTVDAPVAPLTPIDQGAVSPEQARAWAEELQMLERENQSLRDRLQANVADPLADIKVDAVTQIREDVLRARVVELERELDKLHMNHDGDLPQKTAPGKPSAEATPDAALPPPATTATP